MRSHPLLAATAGLAVLGLLTSGCGKSTSAGASKAGAKKVVISLTPGGCTPSPATIPAGPVTFHVSNASADKVSEAELRSGDIIVGEKENLTPGLSGTFSLHLKSGRYSVYCPNARKDTWGFQVTGAAADSALSPATTAALAKATTGYHDYIVDEVGKLVTGTAKFTAAVKAGNVASAKNLFGPARYYYEEVEPVAESFGDLDPGIDARINDVSDPAQWTGFHRIEKALWQDRTAAGLGTYADKLTADVARLQKLVATAHYQPAQLANGATDLLNEVASSKITGEEDRYSHTDLSDFQANVDGANKAYNLLSPALKTIDPTLATTIDARFADVYAALAPYKGAYAGTSYEDYSTVTDDQRRVLTQKVDALAEPLSEVAAKVSG
jgi:iron uptake system component EfeO